MPALAARKALFKVSTTADGSFATVLGIKNVTFSRDGQLIDTSSFGEDWKSALVGMLDATLDIQGNYRPDDTGGQVVMDTAFTAGSDLFIQWLPDGTNGWQMQVMMTKFATDGGVDTAVGLTVSANQTGGVSVIPAP